MYFWITATIQVLARGLIALTAWTGIAAILSIIGGFLGLKFSKRFHLGHDNLSWALLGAIVILALTMPLLVLNFDM